MLGANISSLAYINNGKGTGTKDYLELFNKYDAKEVYFFSDPVYNHHIVARNLRVMDDTKVYKLMHSYNYIEHWGDYTYYDDAGENYDGGVLLYITKGNFETLPTFIQNNFEFCEATKTGELYYSKHDPIDLEVGLPKNRDYSIDLPTTNGVICNNASINDKGYLVSNGNAGHCMFGPYAQTQDGRFEFKLNYRIISSGEYAPGTFDIAYNNGNNIAGSVVLDASATSVTVTADLVSGFSFEYRVYANSGTIIEIQSIEMTRIS
jgi:hypothetical protein